MSIYYEKARELGNLILSSEQAINLTDASTAFNANEEAKRKMEEYKEYKASVQESMDKKAMTQEEFKIASRRLTEMIADLKKDPDIATLMFAENEFNGFVNQVMNILKLTITGAPIEESEEKGCSGCTTSDCNSCG